MSPACDLSNRLSFRDFSTTPDAHGNAAHVSLFPSSRTLARQTPGLESRRGSSMSPRSVSARHDRARVAR